MATVHFNDGTSCSAPGLVESTFRAGDIGKVAPRNPLKKKHRGRICRLTGTYRKYDQAFKVGVIFLDTGKFGYTDTDDLIPVSLEEAAQQPYR